jgi:hypothetical protein
MGSLLDVVVIQLLWMATHRPSTNFEIQQRMEVEGKEVRNEYQVDPVRAVNRVVVN